MCRSLPTWIRTIRCLDLDLDKEIVWSQAAINDLVDIRQHIAGHDPKAAARVAKRILDACDALMVAPRMDRPGRVLGTRELVVASTSYIAPYRIGDTSIELLRVLHGRQSWPQSF